MSEAKAAQFDPELMRAVGQALYIAQEGQLMQKKLSEKPQTSAAEIFFGNLPIFKERRAGREEEMKRLRAQQEMFGKYVMENDMAELLPAIYGKLSPEDMQSTANALTKRLQQQFSLRREVG